MTILKAFAGGLIGALVGAAIWASIYHFAGYEIGFIAWGVGILAGFGVLVALREEEHTMAGVIALLCAVIGLLGGKYAGVRMDMASFATDIRAESDHEHTARVLLADEIVSDWESQGRTLDWPEGMTMDEAWAETDYPEDVWSEMGSRWDAFDDAERERRIGEAERLDREFIEALADGAFLGSFSPHDIVWMFLALGSAWYIAEQDEWI